MSNHTVLQHLNPEEVKERTYKRKRLPETVQPPIAPPKTALEAGPPTAVMQASRGPKKATERLRLQRNRKSVSTTLGRASRLVKARTKRAKR